ncbi:MAG TPA: lipase family protein [Polyangiales bacterium]
MRRQLVVGPSFSELRRTEDSEQVSDGLPVFRRLADILAGIPVEDELSPGTLFDREAVARYVCSVLSCWAYADLDDIAVIMARLGLEKCRCRSLEVANNGALIRSTVFLVQSDCGRIALLAYRGTDPFDFSTWAVSGDLNPATVRVVPLDRGQRAKPEGETVPMHTAAHERLLQRAPALERVVHDVRAATEAEPERKRGRPKHKLRNFARTSARIAGSRLVEQVADEAQRALVAVRASASTGGGLLGLGTGMLRGVTGAVFGRSSAAEAEAAGASVHAGFYRNQRATWFEIASSLESALETGSIFARGERYLDWSSTNEAVATGVGSQPLSHLYVTGHSLGGGLALLASYRIAREPAHAKIASVLRHVHAFAPPMVGNRTFAVAFNERLRDRVSCYLFKNDVVPHLPPKLKGSQDFVHVGQFYQVPERQADKPANECSWELADGPPVRAESAGQLLLAFDASFGDQVSLSSALLSVLRRPALEKLTTGLLGSFVENREYAIYDHFPTHYEACSQLPNRAHRTEFGNDY